MTDSAEPGLPGDTGSASSSAAPAEIDPRLVALRNALDAQGYTLVQFRRVGDPIELWGTVPCGFDYAQVQMIVVTTTGMISLEDHIRVQDEYGG